MLRLILAGILAIPYFLLTIATAPILAILSAPSLLLLIFRKQGKRNNALLTSTKNSTNHVIVFGGSKGIGLAIAKECAAKKNVKNLKITIVARNKKNLDRAQTEIYRVATSSKTKVEATPADVSDYTALEKIAGQIANTQDRTIIFNCAGIPYTVGYEDVPIKIYEKLCRTNLLGSIYITRAFLPHIDNGCIVLCSSAVGQVGVFGYSAYAPTKFALRGFAEAMHAELIRSKPGVSIQLAFPIDTDTPGYEEERKMMPEITKILNADAGLAKPEDVAKKMVDSAFARNPTYSVYFTFEGWMLSNLTAGMSPVSSLIDVLTQVSLNGTFRFISLFYLNDWWVTIRHYKENDNKRMQGQRASMEKSD